MAIQVVILAAGQGKRMQSTLPKVLHQLAGKSLIEHVIQTAFKVSPAVSPIVIYGHEGEILKNNLAHLNVQFVEQKEQLGTAHAVMQALPYIDDEDDVLILYGDVPLISPETLQRLMESVETESMAMLTAILEKPTGYGRIKRNAKDEVIAIIEEKDATESERAITEINPGIYFVPALFLKKWLPLIKSHNAQKEYYLTDMIAQAVEDHVSIHTLMPQAIEEILGVNDRCQLAALERFYQQKIAKNLMEQGVTLRDPARLDIRGEVKIGRDVVIDVNVILEGNVSIGTNCFIGASSIIRNSHIGDNVEVRPFSLIDGAEIAVDCLIGPFARLRPGTVLNERAHIGNFVEVKNSDIGQASKVNHLSYIGDSEIGARVNVGAGTITCNYDGVNKNKTTIGDEAFIGSGTQLIAPVTIGEGATIGAGSTISENAPPHKLTLTRSPQTTVSHWKRPEKKTEKSAK
jgi:bifunctional UDP-N-acetylglucosamine pyrophosphorylase / glucosamine-1-phosphate N-acetyltransferase